MGLGGGSGRWLWEAVLGRVRCRFRKGEARLSAGRREVERWLFLHEYCDAKVGGGAAWCGCKPVAGMEYGERVVGGQATHSLDVQCSADCVCRAVQPVPSCTGAGRVPMVWGYLCVLQRNAVSSTASFPTPQLPLSPCLSAPSLPPSPLPSLSPLLPPKRGHQGARERP